MKMNFGIGFLVFCFGLSNVNAGLAGQVMDIPPVVVQPYEVQELSQQMLDRDRKNRDEEFAIKELIEENNKLTRTTLASQQDQGLSKINQTMLSYRDALLSRDRAHIVANGERWWSSRYGDLVALTEDADAMTDYRGKNDLLAQKYQMLTQLKDEMTALNDKLDGKGQDALNQKEKIIEGYQQVAKEEQDKVQMLVGRLDELDRKISHFDEIMAQKDSQIARLKDSLARVQSESESKDEMIKSQENQIVILQKMPNSRPIDNSQVKQLGMQLSQKQEQVDLLKSELENKITQEYSQKQELSGKDAIIKQQEDQIAFLMKAQPQASASVAQASPLKEQIALVQSEISSKDAIIRQQQNLIGILQGQSKDLSAKDAMYANMQAEMTAIKNKMHSQALALKVKNDSIRWLNQVLAAVKNKAEYYRLTSQQEHLATQEVQREIRQIKDDFAKRFKDYDQFENTIDSLKNIQNQKEERVQQDLQTRLQDKDDQIARMKKDIQADDRVKLARELIDLQQQEASLLDEKGELALRQYDVFERRFTAFEKKMRILLANRRVQSVNLQNRMEELKSERNQMRGQIQDLETRLQDKENQVTALKAELQSGQGTQAQADALRQQLGEQQNKVDLLMQELDSKHSESGKMTVLLEDYQKKLESKDNAYNDQLGQILSLKAYQAQLVKQIADLNARLQEKEAQLIKIKKDMYDLQELAGSKDREAQSKDLSLSIMQQKMRDEKINEYKDKLQGLQAASATQAQEIINLKTELALARQELKGMPSSDEIEFLRTGLEKATRQIKQRDDMLTQTKANADEYAKEYKEQSREFQSLKEQLQDAYEEINRRNEDLKYKNLEVVRLKERSAVKEGDLQDQIKQLTKRGASPSKNDPAGEKLKQALDKIDEQGRLISLLAQKLQEAGQSVDLTHDTGR